MLCRWLLRIAGRLAPRAVRSEWSKRWNSRLCNLCILVDRGEVAGDRAELMLLCSDALSNAFWLRFNRAGLRHWVLGPQFVMALAAAGAILLTLLSRGFHATRFIVDTAIEWNIEPLGAIGRHPRYDPRGDMVVGHVVPIVMALAIGAALVAVGRLSLGRYGWRYWLYLAVKIVAVIVLVPLLWVEGSHWLWYLVAHEGLRVLLGALCALAFLAGFSMAALWAFTDQRRRCPVCLRLLARPVTMGSWASTFDPVTTEFLCDDGHGALSHAENEMGEGDRWVSLDASWREF
ncbi:MAG: hypothetical protein NTW28_23990 [Candidatus Solibacter sp.]|nr:hypothetical protein [Candidatus Solibacter sp.]